jgi:hypothetical protein
MERTQKIAAEMREKIGNAREESGKRKAEAVTV